jgi:hypothetical protein
MLGRPVFLVVSGDTTEPFSTERAARSWADEHLGVFDVYEVTDIRLCSAHDYNRSLVEAKERELAEMRVRLGVPAKEPPT